MRVLDVLSGTAIPTDEEEEVSIGATTALPLLGIDAISTAAYGPEALLSVLLPLGLAALRGMLVLVPLIVVVLILLFISYRQTIPAYPGGGGCYTVAKENLGARPSLLAAAALGLDYILTVAVGIAAGVGALVSAFPALLRWTLPICLAMVALLTLVNLRGFRSSGVAFVIPELVEARWYQFAFHRHTAAMLRRTLLHRGGPQVSVLSAPWHLRESRRERRLARARATAPG